MALVNGKAYDYTQIVLTALGVPVVGVTSISYTEEQEKVNNYGTGARPVSRGRGNIEASGSLDISMNDVEALRDAAVSAGIASGSLLGIPAFDITVTFGNEQAPTTHVLKNVEFASDGMEAADGDTDINRSFDIVMSNVEYRP